MKNKFSYTFYVPKGTIKNASKLSIELNKELIECPYCNTKYTEKMIDRLPALNCINCGGNLK